jgi:hypothetical protein
MLGLHHVSSKCRAVFCLHSSESLHCVSEWHHQEVEYIVKTIVVLKRNLEELKLTITPSPVNSTCCVNISFIWVVENQQNVLCAERQRVSANWLVKVKKMINHITLNDTKQSHTQYHLTSDRLSGVVIGQDGDCKRKWMAHEWALTNIEGRFVFTWLGNWIRRGFCCNIDRVFSHH